MKIIKKILKYSWLELDLARKYAKRAMKCKEDYPTTANMFYEMSLTEISNIEKMQNTAIGMMNEMKMKNPEMDMTTMAIFDFENEKLREEVMEIKIMQEMYKK